MSEDIRTLEEWLWPLANPDNGNPVAIQATAAGFLLLSLRLKEIEATSNLSDMQKALRKVSIK